jgi:hypothetical protein
LPQHAAAGHDRPDHARPVPAQHLGKIVVVVVTFRNFPVRHALSPLRYVRHHRLDRLVF